LRRPTQIWAANERSPPRPLDADPWRILWPAQAACYCSLSARSPLLAGRAFKAGGGGGGAIISSVAASLAAKAAARLTSAKNPAGG